MEVGDVLRFILKGRFSFLPSFPKMLLMTYLGWLLGIGCQPKYCSFIFQPVAVLCNRSRTRRRYGGQPACGAFNKSTNQSKPCTRISNWWYQSIGPGNRLMWSTVAPMVSVSDNQRRSHRHRDRVVLFSPILDVLHVFCSTCCFTTSNAPHLSTERFSRQCL